MKQITADQHAAIVLKSHLSPGASRSYGKDFTTFAKPGETQAAAIKRYMAARKRAAAKAPSRVFPADTSLTSTYHYVHAYYARNDLLPLSGTDGVTALFGELSTDPTTWPESDDVVVEIEA